MLLSEAELAERRKRIESIDWSYSDQPKRDLETCNLCGGSRKVAVAHRDRYGFPNKADACLDCGLVFLNPVMTSEAYGRFYEGVYRPLVSAYYGRRIDHSTVQIDQVPYADAVTKLLDSYIEDRDGRTLLDIGGSTGVVAARLADRFDLEATVLDPAGLEIEQAKRMGLETIKSFLEDYEPGGRAFDIVIMCQTIDHLLDIAGSLTKVHECLSPSGVFFVDVVDFQVAYRRNESVEEAIKVDHPYFLSQATAESYFARHGFRVEEKSVATDGLHIDYVCTRDEEPRTNHLPSAASVEQLFREIDVIRSSGGGSPE